MKKLATGFFIIVLLAVVVYAFTLIESTPVETCVDSDNGVVSSIQGTASGIYLNGTTNFTLTDFCLNSTTLIEYACDNTADPPKLQKWKHGCAAKGNQSACQQGVCVFE